MNHLQHVALIMDGNRRWARQRGKPEVAGHRHGVEAMRQIVKQAEHYPEIKVLTFWAFSTKNFRRSTSFLRQIFQVFREVLQQPDWFNELLENQVRVRTIGRLELFPRSVIELLHQRMKPFEQLKKVKLTVNIALGYEGRDEILRAIACLAQKKLDLTKVSEQQLSQCLDTADQPDPDLLIRTGGEQRLSGFMPWQMTDTELYFTSVLWPDFSPAEFDVAVQDYYQRQRNFGK